MRTIDLDRLDFRAVVRPERIPVTRSTIFDLASLTKPLATTTSVLWLVHDGRVNLDDNSCNGATSCP